MQAINCIIIIASIDMYFLHESVEVKASFFFFFLSQESYLHNKGSQSS